MMPVLKSPRSLWWLALASLGLYLLLPGIAAGLSQAEPSFASEIFPWVKSFSSASLLSLHDSGSHIRASIGFLTLCLALFAVYFFALKQARHHNDLRSQNIIFVSGASFLLVQLLAPVLLSTDVFAYALYGRVVSVCYGNPYDLAPLLPAGDPFLRLFGQDYLPSWYGPLWTWISAGLTRLGGEHVGLTVLLFRLTAIAAALLCGRLLLLSLRRHAPDRAAQGLVFLLWNPLFVIETGISGHNDSVMLVFVLVAVWCHLRGWKTGAVTALLLSALVKFLTGMLIPLYIALVLREAKTGRERIVFLCRCALVAGLVALGGITLAKSNSSSPVSQQAIAPDFYANNFHELIFKAVRRGLGEDPDSVRSPIYFQGWWLEAKSKTFLYRQPEGSAETVAPIKPGDRVVVMAPQQSERWIRVYDPASRGRGFVDAADFIDAARSASPDALGVLFETLTQERPIVQTANTLLRALLWFLFALFGLLCAWRTNSFEQFLVWAAAALLASYFLIVTEIWPWYANWAVALGALSVHRQPARLAAILSACVLTLYVTIGFQGSEPDWVFALRSLPAFVLPLALFAALYYRRTSSRS